MNPKFCKTKFSKSGLQCNEIAIKGHYQCTILLRLRKVWGEAGSFCDLMYILLQAYNSKSRMDDFIMQSCGSQALSII